MVEFDGWLKLSQSLKQKLLPAVQVGQLLNVEDLYAREVFSKPPANYTEASLVKALEELGIGRPSTYAPIISTIQERGYVINDVPHAQQRQFNAYVLEQGQLKSQQQSEQVGGSSRCLQATDIAFVVNDFLTQQFPDILDYDFTARLETDFDHIVDNKVDWKKMLADFYEPFHAQVGEAETVERQKINNTRILGSDHENG